jgi:head-tail adaptor
MVAKYRQANSGDLRLICTIEKLDTDASGNPAVDDTGSPTATYSAWAENVRFAFDDWRPYEQFNASQVERQLSTRIRIRYRPELTAGAIGNFRIVYCTNPGASPSVNEIYDILGAVRDPTTRIDMNLTCTLRDSPGFRQGAPT